MTTTAAADPRRAFWAVSATLFAASVAGTVVWCASMSDMPAMPMPGGWAMSMAWMRMPRQTWPGAAAAFIGMWLAMMVAMMLPSLAPMLRRYRVTMAGAARRTWLTALVGVGYFFVWSAIGLLAFVLGAALAAVAMQLPAIAQTVPVAIGLIILIAGALQFTSWKAYHLACCRNASARCDALSPDTGTAWRYGVRLGFHCSACCEGLMTILLVAGVMDLRVMAVVMAAITVERVAGAGHRVARVIGTVAIGSGLLLIWRAIGFG